MKITIAELSQQTGYPMKRIAAVARELHLGADGESIEVIVLDPDMQAELLRRLDAAAVRQIPIAPAPEFLA